MSAVGSGSTMPRIHSPALQAQAAGSRSLGAASPRRQGAPASAPAAAMAAPGGTQSAAEGAAASDGLRGLVGELEERLASLLPSVGVVHLGCSQAAGSFVLRWRQRLQVVVEPSECLDMLCLKTRACQCLAVVLPQLHVACLLVVVLAFGSSSRPALF